MCDRRYRRAADSDSGHIPFARVCITLGAATTRTGAEPKRAAANRIPHPRRRILDCSVGDAHPLPNHISPTISPQSYLPNQFAARRELSGFAVGELGDLDWGHILWSWAWNAAGSRGGDDGGLVATDEAAPEKGETVTLVNRAQRKDRIEAVLVPALATAFGAHGDE